MNTQITPEDAKNLLVLVNRTQLTGAEAESVVIIKQKLIEIAKPKAVKEVKEKVKEEVKKENE